MRESTLPRWENAAAILAIILPAVIAAANVAPVPDVGHDLAVIRAVGLGWTGIWRALDAVVAAVVTWVPLGTRAWRAGLASAACAGVAGLALYALARRLVAQCGGGPRIGPAVAAVASTTATLGIAWQMEAASPGGSVLGALLALAPLVIASRAKRVQDALIAPLGIALGLGLSYEPLVGAAGLASAGVYVAALARRDAMQPRDAARALIPALAGAPALLVPPAYAWIRGHADARMVLPRGALAGALGEAGASPRAALAEVLRVELGWVLGALVVAGIALAALRPRARPLLGALLAVGAVGALGIALGAPAGPSRWGGSTLAALGASLAVAAVAMQELVARVAAARIPLARASAAMIVVLLVALPARVADDAWARAAERGRGGSAAWDEAAWGTVPDGAVALVGGARAIERVVAARATGAMRADIAVVPLDALGGRMASREIAREAKLQPFARDMALEGAPEELSLSSLAAARPLVMTFDTRWDRALARHLVPVGLFARFEPEPRGASDRRRALAGARPDLERLEHVATAPRDLDLCAAAALLLRARALAWAAANDRELIALGLDELRPFSPDDRVASELARRAITAKGAIDVKDLGR